MTSTTLCSDAGCDRAVVARRLCRKHYLRAWRAGEAASLPGRTVEVIVCPADHEHTAETCWLEHGCRCARCTHSRRMERQRRRNRLLAYGRAEQIRGVLIAAEPVRQHVTRLQEESRAGLERIADAAGVSRSALIDLKFGPRGANRKLGLPTQIRSDVAEAVMAVAPDDISLAVVPALGTVRRLRALVRIGHTQTALANRMGWSVMNLSRLILGRQERVSAKTHDVVSAMFDELWDTPGTGTHSDAARRKAEQRRWLPPLAWDDPDTDPEPPVVDGGTDVIDEVAVELALAGERPRLTPAERRECVQRLHREHWSDGRIAETLGCAARTVLRIRDELGLQAFDQNDPREKGAA